MLAAHYIGWDYWLELSGGTRRPADAAARIRAAASPYGVCNDAAWAVAAAVRAGVALPPLILVRADRAPPGAGASGLVVREGHVRRFRTRRGGAAADAGGAHRDVAGGRGVDVLPRQLNFGVRRP